MSREGLIVGGIMVIGGILAIWNSPRSETPKSSVEAPVTVEDSLKGAKVVCTAVGSYKVCHGLGLEKRCYSQTASGTAGGLHTMHAQGRAEMKCGDAILMASVINTFGDGFVESGRSCVVTRCSDVK